MPCPAATVRARWAYYVRLLFWLQQSTGLLSAVRSQRLLALRGQLRHLCLEVSVDGENPGTGASSASSTRERPPPRRNKVLPPLSKCTKAELIAIATRYHILPPDPHVMTVPQLRNYMHLKDSDLELDDSDRMVDIGMYKDQMTYAELAAREVSYCEWCLSLDEPSAKMKRLQKYLRTARTSTRGAQSGPTGTRPTGDPTSGRTTGSNAGPPRNSRTRPAPDDGEPASMDTSRSPYSEWEALGRPSPIDYLASVDQLFSHVTARMTNMPGISATMQRLLTMTQDAWRNEVTSLNESTVSGDQLEA